MKTRNIKKPGARCKSPPTIIDEEMKSSIVEESLASLSDGEQSNELSLFEDSSHAQTSVSNDLRKAALNFEETNHDAFEILKKETQGFQRLYSSIKTKKFMLMEPLKSIDSNLLKEVFKTQRQSHRQESSATNLPASISETFKRNSKRTISDAGLSLKDTRPTKLKATKLGPTA